MFGVALLNKALINGRSSNWAAEYPPSGSSMYDILPIAGFQWYDTRVMTILSDVTFQNFW